MTKFRIRYTEVYQYGKTPAYKTATVVAHSFKVNDQGTAVFTDQHGTAVASFKHWVTIKPVAEAEKPIRVNETAILPAPTARSAGGWLGTSGKRHGQPYI